MPQRRINETDLPSPAEKLEILQATVERLNGAGYVFIGMDHFAKPNDELAIAQRTGTLYRNFQGYSTHADCDLVAMGITAIGKVGDSYSQNVKDLETYYERIGSRRLSVFRGVKLGFDDLLRREIITRLICDFRLSFEPIESKYDIRFGEYFPRELSALAAMQEDGLLKLEDGYIEILPPGRLLVRNICMVFDRYLAEAQNKRFSKVI